MKADEDEDDDTTIGQAHYPCLPSLVALQQMRNRLHMAHDGKRLMKWSAMATGRELRRIAAELNQIFQGFYEDVKNVYILLARCRYFYPNLNKMTTANVGNKAVVTVDKSSKCVTGVRITKFHVVEDGTEPFPFLGIDQGGRAIRDAKDAWLEYLKRLIVILELRTSFRLIEYSNKSATKKSNVLGKIIIPKTELTIRYILAELEEREREEFFRLKKVLEIKYRHKKKKGNECPLCKAEKEEEAARKKAEERKKRQRCIVCNGPMKSDPNKVVAKDDGKKKVDLQNQLDKIIQITKEYEQKGIQSNIVDELKLMAEQLRDKLKSGDFLPENADPNKLCDACRKRFQVSAPLEDKAMEGDGVCDICEQHSVGPMSVEISLPPPEKQASIQRTPTPSVQSRVSPTPSIKSKASQKSVSQPQQIATCEKHTPEPDLELGVFETDVKEIVKIVRKRNEDGTITEEKMVITIKKESKSPAATSQEQPSASSSRAAYRSSETSNKSNAYGGNKRVGLLTVSEARRQGFDDWHNVLRDVKSYLELMSPHHGDSLGRYCKSWCSTISIDSEFARQLQDKMKSESNLPPTISNTYFIRNTIGLATTAATNRPFHVPRESYYLPVAPMMADPVARCCNSSNNIISIDSIFDVMAEQNKRKPADFTNAPMAVPNDLDKENKEDTEKRLFDEIESQVHSFYLSLPSPVSDVNRYHMPSINTSSTISGIEKLSKQAPVNKVAEIAKIDTTSSIQMPLSEIIYENEQDNQIIERQYSERTDECNLEETEEKIKLSVDPFEPIKTDELKPKLYEVIEKEINKFQPLRSVIYKTNSTKNNLNLGVRETETQDIVRILRIRNNDGTITEEKNVIKIVIQTTYSSDTKANNVSDANQPDTDDEKMVFKSSHASIKSDDYFDCKSVGMSAIFGSKKRSIIAGLRAVKSYVTLPSLPMADNLTRYCDSSTSMISIDNEFEAVCKCLINNSDCKEGISSDLREYVTSSTEFDQLMESFEPTQYTEVASTSRNC